MIQFGKGCHKINNNEVRYNGNEYYYQVLLLNVPFRSEGELISDPNASGTFKEECFLRNLVRQFADQRKR